MSTLLVETAAAVDDGSEESTRSSPCSPAAEFAAWADEPVIGPCCPPTVVAYEDVALLDWCGEFARLVVPPTPATRVRPAFRGTMADVVRQVAA